MRIRFAPVFLLGLAALTASLAAPPAFAQKVPRVKVDKVRVGLPSAVVQGEFKSGFWTPVYVDVVAGLEGVPKGDLIVETTDCDDVRNDYRVPLPPLEPNERVTVTAYTKPSSIHPEVVAWVRIDNRDYPYHKENYNSMQLGEVLYATVGTRLIGLRRAFATIDKQNAEDDAIPRDSGPQRIVAVDDLRDLPTRWFGYEAVDVLILSSGNRDFMSGLISDREGRKEAIAEWVRRGGRLIVTAGVNQDMVAAFDAAIPLLPVAVAGTAQVNSLRMLPYADVKTAELLPVVKGAAGKAPTIEIAKLEPKQGREFDRLLPKDAAPNEPLLMARGAFGLGQVVVLAVDVDRLPFSTWAGQRDFWRKLMPEIGPRPVEQNVQQGRNFNIMNPDDDLASQLQKNLENFPNVPVVSFGWVALFILIYIIIVGPLDYFFLKKVVKRLELTWITFPTVVVVISVASYFIAYYLKGNDQLINKLDLVDVDLQGKQVYGHTWFTIFSPRIQHYTVGIESADSWLPASPDAQKNSSVLLSWMGRPDTGFGGAGRASSQSLFRRTYDYERDATGLRGVPIQVWTTKSFTSDWQMPIDPAKPIFKADLRQPPDRATNIDSTPTGTITSGLPIEMEDCYLLYRNKAYSLDRLLPNIPKRVDNLFGKPLDITTWLGDTRYQGPPQIGQQGGGKAMDPCYHVIKRLEFYRADPTQKTRDTLLHALDLTWRLGHSEEMILVGLVPRKDGLAEETATSPNTPSRLWLGQLPYSGLPRPEIQGSMSQQTFVRVILPIRSGDAAKP